MTKQQFKSGGTSQELIVYFNLLVRFFLLLFCLEGFPLPGGEACLPLRSLAAQVTSLLWSCNVVPLAGIMI